MKTAKEVVSRLKTSNGNGRHGITLRMSVEDVGPKKAEQWLTDRFGANRPPRTSHVSNMAKAMRNGAWALNGEALKFDWDGMLRDGQHRLMAIVESGATITTVVIRGLDPAVFPTMDQGAKRSGADHVAVLGKENYAMLGAALSMLRRYERGDLASTVATDRHVTGPEVVETLERYPGIEASTAFAHACSHVLSPSQVCFFHFVFSAKNKPLADDFFTRLGNGLGLTATDPVYHLRERLLSSKADRTKKLTPKYQMAIIIKAWNATREGRDVRTLRWDTERETFPKIV